MEQLIESFYTAFNALRPDEMAACYHEDIRFEDPAFGLLIGQEAVSMWHMLCASQKGRDFKVNLTELSCAEQKGRARWEAQYTFSKTGRRVHNIINAEFHFRDGKIFQHIDHFDLYRWARQAFGLNGILIGWTPAFRSKLRNTTRSALASYMEKNS